MNYKDLVNWFRKKKKSWDVSHAQRQKEFDEGYKYGIREVGWNPFKKK
jgi:hypothetical protein